MDGLRDAGLSVFVELTLFSRSTGDNTEGPKHVIELTMETVEKKKKSHAKHTSFSISGHSKTFQRRVSWPIGEKCKKLRARSNI